MFGSFVNKTKFNDVDIILVYKNKNLNLIKETKKKIINHFISLNIDVDLTILSEKELIDSNILNKIDYKKIK